MTTKNSTNNLKRNKNHKWIQITRVANSISL